MHFLIPWEAVRIALLAVSVWGLVWMIGLLASLNVHPPAGGISGRTNVHVALAGPVTVATPKGPLEITAISFWADDHRDLVATLRARVSAA